MIDYILCKHCETANPSYLPTCEKCNADLHNESANEGKVFSTNYEKMPPKKMNPFLYSLMYIAVFVITLIVYLNSYRAKAAFNTLVCYTVLFTIFHLVFVYNMWKAIDDGETGITPFKAIFFHFIPIFNLFWTPLVIVMFPGAYNQFVERNKVGAFRFSSGLFTVYLLIFIINLFFTFAAMNSGANSIQTILFVIQSFIYLILVYKICSAVNILWETASASAGRKAVSINP